MGYGLRRLRWIEYLCEALSDRHVGRHVKCGEWPGGVPGYHHFCGPSRRRFCRSASAARSAVSLTR